MDNAASHRLVIANPREQQDGSLNRGVLVTRISSLRIVTLLMRLRRQELLDNTKEKFISALKKSALDASDGMLFEGVGHVYVLDRFRQGPLEVARLGRSDTHALHLTHVENVTVFEGRSLPQDLKHWLYYRPAVMNFPGINSFALEKTETGLVKAIVLFQFTISSRHPINPTALNALWNHDETARKWQWKLVFVIPQEAAVQFKREQPFEPVTPKMQIQQYLWKVDVESVWNAASNRDISS